MIEVMKVSFNARTLSAPLLLGWSRYSSNLIRELCLAGVKVYLFSDRKLNEELLKGCSKDNVEVVVKSGLLYIDWEQRVLASLCKEYQIDILHCPINYGLPIYRNWKQVLTLHDAIEKAFYDPHKSFFEKISFDHLYVRALHRLAQNSSDKIITVSKHAALDIEKFYGVSSNKIEVIYEAADPIFTKEPMFSKEDLKKKFNLSEDYLFYVGGFEKRKNIEFLLEALSKTKKNSLLAIAGGGAEINELRSLSIKMGISHRVKLLGWVEDQFLPSLYHYARALVYPSFYEGFGLQIVEAMAQSCPVLCSNQTSLPEVWGSELGTFDPCDREGLSSLLDKVVEDEQFYQGLKAWSCKRHQNFSWKKTAQETIKVYESLLSQSETSL